MKIRYWTSFSKRKNSTAQPSGGTEIDVTLKQGTSLENPTFILSLSNAHNIVYVKAFDHYYFVSDVIYVHNQTFEVVCSQDVLATYKGAITGSQQYVLRSAVDYDIKIPDSNVSMRAEQTVNDTGGAVSNLSAQGLYALTVANEKASSGYACTYILDASGMRALAVYLNSTITDSVADWFAVRYKSVFDAIISCVWIPISISAVGFGKCTTSNIFLGNTDTGISALQLTDITPLKCESALTNLTWKYNDFRMAGPYTKASLYIPLYGCIDVNPLDIIDGLELESYVDCITGDTTTYLLGKNGTSTKLVSTLNYNIGVNCALSQTIQGGAGTITSLASAGASAIGGNAFGVISGLAGAAFDAFHTNVSTKGSISGRSMISVLAMGLTVYYMETTDPAELVTTHGRPCMGYRSLSDLSGYTLCSNAQISISGPDEDRVAIEAFMNGGFYLE